MRFLGVAVGPCTPDLFKSGLLFTRKGMVVAQNDPGEEIFQCGNCKLKWPQRLLEFSHVEYECRCGYLMMGLLNEIGRDNIAFDVAWALPLIGDAAEEAARKIEKKKAGYDEDRFMARFEELRHAASEKICALPFEAFKRAAQRAGFIFVKHRHVVVRSDLYKPVDYEVWGPPGTEW